VIAFGGGMMALGAYSIGHEYVHRTAGLMLTLPVERRRIFLVKLTVAAAMVLALAAYASLRRLFAAPDVPLWLVAAGALSLVPAMTMLCRNALSGVLLSTNVATLLLVAILVIRVGRWDSTADAARAAFDVWSRAMLAVLAAAAVLAWPLFKRLEWIESGVEMSLPSWIAPSRDAAPGAPLWQLMKKEIRLQRIAFSLAALYVAAAAAEAALRIVRPHDLPFMAPVSMGYWVCVPVLIGSIAIAEERQLGTASWQLMLPAPAWRQWTVKAGTVLGLALLLGIAVPVLTLQLLGSHVQLGYHLPDARAAIVQTLVLAAASLYVSSRSRSAVMAVAVSFAAIAVCLWLADLFAHAAGRSLYQPLFGTGINTTVALAMLALTAVLMRFAYVNHRYEKP